MTKPSVPSTDFWLPDLHLVFPNLLPIMSAIPSPAAIWVRPMIEAGEPKRNNVPRRRMKVYISGPFKISFSSPDLLTAFPRPSSPPCPADMIFHKFAIGTVLATYGAYWSVDRLKKGQVRRKRGIERVWMSLRERDDGIVSDLYR